MGRLEPLVIIPAFNEALTLGSLLKELRSKCKILVIDDGSTDDTVKVAQKNGVDFVSHNRNLGYAAALESGFKYAVNANYTHVITCDADGEHDPKVVLQAVKVLEKEPQMLIIGKRQNRRRLSEHLAGSVCKKIWGIEDIFCGFKVYSLDLWERYKKFETYDSCGTQLFLNGIRDGKKYIQLSVDGVKRNGNSRFDTKIKAHIRILKQIYYFIISKC